MVKIKKEKIKFKAFELKTPITVGNTQYNNTYNYQVIDILFQNILKVPKDQRKYKNNEVTFNLLKYKQSDNTHIMQGIFSTARHGEVKETINTETQEVIIEKEILPIEGVKNEIIFTIDKRSGLLLIQEDKLNHVISRSILKLFINKHRSLIYPYIEQFNNEHLVKKATLSKRPFYTLTTLPPIDFFEKLKEFKSIKSGILYINKSEKTEPTDVIKGLEEELNDYEITDYDVEIKIKNKSPLGIKKAFEQYFKQVKELQKYDSYAIEGVTKVGSVKKITPDTFTREFEVLIEKNSSGLLNQIQIVEEMQKIINSKANPLYNDEKENTFSSTYLLKEVSDIQNEIDKILSGYDKPQKTEEEKDEAREKAEVEA